MCAVYIQLKNSCSLCNLLGQARLGSKQKRGIPMSNETAQNRPSALTDSAVHGEVVKDNYTIGDFFADLGQAAVTLVMIAGILYLKREFKV